MTKKRVTLRYIADGRHAVIKDGRTIGYVEHSGWTWRVALQGVTKSGAGILPRSPVGRFVSFRRASEYARDRGRFV